MEKDPQTLALAERPCNPELRSPLERLVHAVGELERLTFPKERSVAYVTALWEDLYDCLDHQTAGNPDLHERLGQILDARSTMIELKAWPDVFVELRNRCYDVRLNDKPYAQGDLIRYREWVPKDISGAYTGRELTVRIFNLWEPPGLDKYIAFSFRVEGWR